MIQMGEAFEEWFEGLMVGMIPQVFSGLLAWFCFDFDVLMHMPVLLLL